MSLLAQAGQPSIDWAWIGDHTDDMVTRTVDHVIFTAIAVSLGFAISLVLSLVIIFAGTWAQRFHGIWEVQKQYFHSWVAWVPFAIFMPPAMRPSGNVMSRSSIVVPLRSFR